jgi:flagellar biogenesis protein FliO
MSALLTTALLLATATPPTGASGSNEQLRALLQQLTSENDDAENDDLEAAPAPKLRSYKQTKKKVEKKAKEEPVAAEATKSSKKSFAAASSLPVGSVAAFFVFGLAAALALVVWSRRREAIDARPLRRIASEAIGRNQQIVLVEALGEYLLVATSGRETALIAQLDARQAAERIEALQSNSPAPKPSGTFGFLNRFKKQSAFEEILEQQQSQSPSPVPPAENSNRPSLSAQVALQKYAATANGGSSATADTDTPRMAMRPVAGAKRADEIRRRLKAL